jgi:hypothetical protein
MLKDARNGCDCFIGEFRVKVKAVGMGKVKTQSLQAGQDIIKNNHNIRIVIILKDIYKVAIEAVSGSKEVAVHKIEFDSRKIEVNDVFCSWFRVRRA